MADTDSRYGPGIRLAVGNMYKMAAGQVRRGVRGQVRGNREGVARRNHSYGNQHENPPNRLFLLLRSKLPSLPI